MRGQGRDEHFFYSAARLIARTITAEDAPILLECAFKAALVIPDCSCTVLAQCGHWPQLEMADTFNALVLEFLDRVD